MASVRAAPWSMSSSTPKTVTVWGAFQFRAVNVRVSAAAPVVAASGPSTSRPAAGVTAMVTSLRGAAARTRV